MKAVISSALARLARTAIHIVWLVSPTGISTNKKNNAKPLAADRHPKSHSSPHGSQRFILKSE
jgi:hypothetical protein